LIGPLIRFLPEFASRLSERLRDRIRAVVGSLRFSPGALIDQQFHRFANYTAIREVLVAHYGTGEGILALEVGGSNGVVGKMLPSWRYEVAPNFPEVDVQNLDRYLDKTYDVVILDQVLEHVRHPQRAVDEIFRVLKPGGICIATTPFLIQVHGYPDDFWRFTSSGLRELFRAYEHVTCQGWGNKSVLRTISRYGWITSRNAKRLLAVALWNELEWPIEFLTIARK
jgi:SAM-dependent methyltransferase